MEYERVELVQARYGTVNVYRLGDTLVDTGHVNDESRDRLLSELRDGRLAGVERVVLTHPHIDHVGGSQTIGRLTALPHVVFEGADDIIHQYDDYVVAAREEMGTFSTHPDESEVEPDDQYFPLDVEYATDAITIERVVEPGDTVRVGPYDCTVVHTPGHSQQHMSLYHEGTGAMLSGDIISENGHFLYGPLHWDVGAYKTGLHRIRDCDPDCLLPGHGGRMDHPQARVEDALQKAERAEESILDVVAEHGTVTAHDLAAKALGASEQTVGFLAAVASAYAVHLAERGVLEVERQPYVVASPA